MKQLFTILAKRLKSKSPKLFEKIAIGAAVIGGVALLIPILPIALPAGLVSVLPLISSACGGIATVSLITTDNKQIIKETDSILTK